MKKERDNTKVVLIDIKYEHSLNFFECEYGEHIRYQEIEQKSYIEFKEILFINISRDIKFRKYGRLGQVLTIKADMLDDEIEKLKKTLEEDKIKMIHNWIVSNVTIITDSKNFDEKNNKFLSNKDKSLDDEGDEDEQDEKNLIPDIE